MRAQLRARLSQSDPAENAACDVRITQQVLSLPAFQAAERIFGLLPEDQGKKMRALWDEFEARETPEAKFARTLDCVQPTMLNDASEGKSWLEHGVHLGQVLGRNARTAEGSEALWDYARTHFVEPHVGKELKAD